jgi:hypothetical protein
VLIVEHNRRQEVRGVSEASVAAGPRLVGRASRPGRTLEHLIERRDCRDSGMSCLVETGSRPHPQRPSHISRGPGLKWVMATGTSLGRAPRRR